MAIFSEKAPAKGPRASLNKRLLFLFTLLKNGQVNFIVQISKFPSQNTDY